MCIINNQSNQNIINQYSCWKTFPWQRIYLRVLMIKKQIYLNSKKHNLINVHNLQKYLINCNEAKILLINKILARTYLYYQYHERSKFLIDNEQRFNLFASLFNQNDSNDKATNKITQHVKQHLICISINPTWKARLTKSTTNYFSICKLNSHLIEDNNIKYFNYSKSSKYFLIRTIASKLKSSNYINKSITNWLNNQDCLDLSIVHNLQYSKYLNTLSSKFYQLITKTSCDLGTLFLKILLIDPFWSLFNSIKKENKSKILLIYNLKYNCLKINNNYIYSDSQSLSDLIRLFLYRKNYCGQNKINSFINKENLLSRVNKMCKQFYNINLNLIHISTITNCNKLTNNFIHHWTKKQSTIIPLPRVKVSKIQHINAYLNRYIYLCNTNNYYLSLM